MVASARRGPAFSAVSGGFGHRGTRLDKGARHGNDSRRWRAEAWGLSAAIGSELSTIPASSLKPALGHCLGASGAIEAVAAILALREGFVPATVGWAGADPALPALLLQDHIQVPRSPKALLLSESFGGKTVAIAVRA